MDTPKNPHGCHNRDPFKDSFLAQDGYVQDGGNIQQGLMLVPRYVRVKFIMSRDCRYDVRATDPRCTGCKHINPGEPQ